MEVKFSKYEGAGNDFVLIDTRSDDAYSLDRQQIASICHRRFGVGADGLMMLGRGEGEFDFSMRYFNADGGESTMCGNGGRCIARFAEELGIGGAVKHFSAIDGDHFATINPDGTITLSMIDVHHIEQVDEGYLLNTGSPHLVVENRAFEESDARALREKYDCNVNYIELCDTDPKEFGADLLLGIETYERGVEAATFACGTGATAAAIVVDHLYRPLPTTTPNRIVVEARGGRLIVGFTKCDGRYQGVTLTGGANKVFSGVLDI